MEKIIEIFYYVAIAFLSFCAFVMIYTKIQTKYKKFTLTNIYIKMFYGKRPYQYLYEKFYSEDNTSGFFVTDYFNAFLYNITSKDEEELVFDCKTIVKNSSKFLFNLCSDTTVYESKRKVIIKFVLMWIRDLATWTEGFNDDFSDCNLILNNFQVLQTFVSDVPTLNGYKVKDLTNGIEKTFYDFDSCVDALFSEERFEIERLPAKIIAEAMQTAN